MDDEAEANFLERSQGRLAWLRHEVFVWRVQKGFDFEILRPQECILWCLAESPN